MYRSPVVRGVPGCLRQGPSEGVSPASRFRAGDRPSSTHARGVSRRVVRAEMWGQMGLSGPALPRRRHPRRPCGDYFRPCACAGAGVSWHGVDRRLGDHPRGSGFLSLGEILRSYRFRVDEQDSSSSGCGPCVTGRGKLDAFRGDGTERRGGGSDRRFATRHHRVAVRRRSGRGVIHAPEVRSHQKSGTDPHSSKLERRSTVPTAGTGATHGGRKESSRRALVLPSGYPRVRQSRSVASTPRRSYSKFGWKRAPTPAECPSDGTAGCPRSPVEQMVGQSPARPRGTRSVLRNPGQGPDFSDAAFAVGPAQGLYRDEVACATTARRRGAFGPTDRARTR